MSRKRSIIPDIYKYKKRSCLAPSSGGGNAACEDGKGGSCSANDLTSETKASLLYLRGLFPMEKFEHRLPPVVLKHQIYSLIKNKTAVDKQLNDLKATGEIKVFKLGSEADEYSIVFAQDYKSHVLRVMAEVGVHRAITEKFVSTVINHCHDVSVSKDTLMKEYLFKDEEITQLVRASVLTVRDIGSWWVAVPNAGIFMKSFVRGRKALTTMIRKCKYREILKSDLELRKWPKIAKLGLVYHIHDIIGAELVDCIQTTSGQLLRLKD